MRERILAIILSILFFVNCISIVDGVSINEFEKELDINKMTMEELIRNFDPNCKNMSDEEINEYIEKVRIESPPRKEDIGLDLSNLQKPTISSCGSLIYEPPWDLHYFDCKEEKWGIADAGCEGEADGYQGWTNIAAAAGPGAGESSMTVWIQHGIYFKAPVTERYNVYFDYLIQGWVSGAVTWIDACVSSEVALFFRVAGQEIRDDILYQQTVPIVYQQYDQDFMEHRTPKISVDFYENNYYYIEVIAGIKARAFGALIDFGYSYGHFDNEGRGGWGDGTVLNSIKIEWPNHPPEKPSSPNPSNEATDVNIDTDLSWTCDDSDGDKLTYDIYFGTNSNPSKIESDYTLTRYSFSNNLENETIYYWKIVAKDQNGGTSTSDTWSFTTAKKPKNLDNRYLTNLIQKLNELLAKIISLKIIKYLRI